MINDSLSQQRKFIPTYAIVDNKYISDALNINFSNAIGEENNVGYVYSGGTMNLPDDCIGGIREVFYYNESFVVVQITGRDTSNIQATWINGWVGTQWIGWERQLTPAGLFNGRVFYLDNYIVDGKLSVVDCQNIIGSITDRVVIMNGYYKTEQDIGAASAVLKLPEQFRPRYRTVAISCFGNDGKTYLGGISADGSIYFDNGISAGIYFRIYITYFRY